ncbi:hypothetical protein ABIB99_004943 [Bradyrhizobium sp. LA6.1]|uniref:hypothetical protein n=1 Tax=Bradyrhizobium sp. LA6.1 TaxID=3156378 RepID=UPI003399BC31
MNEDYRLVFNSEDIYGTKLSTGKRLGDATRSRSGLLAGESRGTRRRAPTKTFFWLIRLHYGRRSAVAGT